MDAAGLGLGQDSGDVGDRAQRIGGLVADGLVIGATAQAGQLSDGRADQFGHHS